MLVSCVYKALHKVVKPLDNVFIDVQCGGFEKHLSARNIQQNDVCHTNLFWIYMITSAFVQSLTLAMTLHEKGRAALKTKKFSKALLLLLEADKEFG